jgi:type IV secretion system protein VirB9
MKRASLLLALATFTTTAASAQDKRIQTLVYDPEAIVEIVGREGIQSTVEFGPNERIENVAVGNSAAWQITPNRRASLLFLKPLQPATRTNMTVVTDRHMYMFDLVAGPKHASPVYALKFTYPNDDEAAPSEAAAQVAAAQPTPPPFSPEQLNFGWQTKGSDRLLPSKIFDDGKVLYLAWSADATLPAILTVSSDGREGPVNYRTAGDFIVVDPLPSNILLREGKRSATIRQGRPMRPNAAPATYPVAAPPAATVQQAAPRQSARLTVHRPDLASLYSVNLSGGSDAHQ